MSRYLAALLLLFLPLITHAAPLGDCKGTPADAVLQLPAPLSQWGSIACTPYGHIITNHDGWIWSHPGAYAPVFIASQMVQSDLKKTGNRSYFTRIHMAEVPLSNQAAEAALSALNDALTPAMMTKAYRLEVSGSLGKSMVLYFFTQPNHVWGIWCNAQGAGCEEATGFMVIDRSEAGMPSPR